MQRIAGVCLRFHTAAVPFCHAADDRAAIHGEFAAPRFVTVNHHTAAIVVGLTADYAAAVHGELAARCNIHTTAALGAAAVDDAATDGFCTVGFIPHPQAAAVGGELVFCVGSAVDDGQMATVLDDKDAAAAVQCQRIAVEVQFDFAGNLQGFADYNAHNQPANAIGGIIQRVSQVFVSRLVDVLGKYACRHKT